MEFRGCPKAIPSGLGKRCAVVAAYEQTSGAARRRELPSRVRARSTCRLSTWQKPVPITGRLARKEPAGLSAAADFRNKQ
jgi:hypothetical protein